MGKLDEGKFKKTAVRALLVATAMGVVGLTSCSVKQNELPTYESKASIEASSYFVSSEDAMNSLETTYGVTFDMSSTSTGEGTSSVGSSTTGRPTTVAEATTRYSRTPKETTSTDISEEATSTVVDPTEVVVEGTTEGPSEGTDKATEQETTEKGTTQSPTTAPTTTQAPTTVAPTTQSPTTQAPTTQAPTTQAPTTTAHSHVWVKERVQTKAPWDETVKVKDAWTETKTEVVKPAWDEQVLVKAAWTETKQELVRAAWDEQVLVKEAWTEYKLIKEAWDETYIYWEDVNFVHLTFCAGCEKEHGKLFCLTEFAWNNEGMWDFDNMKVTQKYLDWMDQHTKAHALNGFTDRTYSGYRDYPVRHPFKGVKHHDAEYEEIKHDAEYKTVHHDAEYKTVTINHPAEYKTVHHPAETRQVKIEHPAEYKTIHHDAEYTEREKCSTCGEYK